MGGALRHYQVAYIKRTGAETMQAKVSSPMNGPSYGHEDFSAKLDAVLPKMQGEVQDKAAAKAVEMDPAEAERTRQNWNKCVLRASSFVLLPQSVEILTHQASKVEEKPKAKDEQPEEAAQSIMNGDAINKIDTQISEIKTVEEKSRCNGPLNCVCSIL